MSTKAVITADQARQALSAELRTRNAKTRTELPPELQIMGEPVHVFSLWHEPFIVGRGGMGTYTIPACPTGEEHSAPLKIDYIMTESVPVEIDKAEDRMHSGRGFAEDIVGIGKFKTPSDDLRQYGVFVAAGPVPTKEELATANKARDKKLRELIAQADAFHQEGPAQAINIQSLHRFACDQLGLDKPWNASEKPMMDCPGCSARIPKSAAIHNCGNGMTCVIDPDRARSLGLLPKDYDDRQKKAAK